MNVSPNVVILTRAELQEREERAYQRGTAESAEEIARLSSICNGTIWEENVRLRTALENIALLDFADGYELTWEHASRAVAIATSTLGKHPSEIRRPPQSP